MPTSYHDEKLLLDHLVQRLEDRLAGRNEPEIVRTQPSDHCQLGVLAPWTAEPELEEQPDAATIEELRAENRVAIPATRPAARLAVPAAIDADPEQVPTVEAFALREDAARRPPSALGLAVAIRPDRGRIAIRVTGRCAVYSRHFPDFQAQRLEVGNRPTEGAPAAGRQHVSLIEKFRRHVIDLPAVTLEIDSAHLGSYDDSGALQEVFSLLAAQLRADSTTLRRFDGNRIVPVTALHDEATFSRFLQSWRGPPEVADLRVSLRVRTQPTNGGLRLEVHLCNNSRRDLDRPSNDQFSSLYDAQIRVTLLAGDLVPIELLPVPEDYQYDRNVYALGRNAGAEVAPDRRSVVSCALARYEQERMRTQDRVSATYSELADDPIPVLERIHTAMRDYARDWVDRVIATNALHLTPEALVACQSDLSAFEAEVA